MSTRNTFHYLGLLALVIILPLAVFGAAYMFTTLEAQPEGIVAQIALVIALGAVFLAIPYWMLKLGSKAAHMKDSKSRIVRLRDIGKDQEQLSGSRR